MKTKIKSHGEKVTDFYDKKIPKLDANHTCLTVISLDSALKEDDNYYQQDFLKECKCIEKKQLGIFMIIWVIFLFLMNPTENILELFRVVSKNIGHYFSNRECTHKRVLYF